MEKLQNMEMNMFRMRGDEMEMAMRSCMSCSRVCMETMMYAMNMGGKMAKMDMMNMLRDCADMCMMAEMFMMRDSMMAGEMCRMCADMCEMCATKCDSMEDEMMMSCAMMCRKCAESCRQMVPMSV